MSDKKKIILMYSGIAIFGILLIATFNWMRVAQEERELRIMEARVATDVGKAAKERMVRLENDLVATNQDGETVRISDLKDKVWIATEFFAACPNCAARNGDHLLKFYNKFKDRPDFHVVCVSIDPETDQPERLREYAAALNVDSSNWWFLTGSREEIHRYMEEEMRFLGVRERVDPIEIEAQGKYAHDMGVAVFGKGLVMLEKKDLFYAREQSQEMYDHFEGQLMEALEKGFAAKSDE